MHISTCTQVVCSVLALNLGAVLIGSDCILREVGAGAQKKKRAIKRFRNRASSNHDFRFSISINRTALVHSIFYLLTHGIYLFINRPNKRCTVQALYLLHFICF